VTLRSPIFRKLLFSAFLLIAATLLALDFYLTRYTAARQTEQVQRRLTSEGLVLLPEVSDVPPSQLEDWTRQAAARARARITVVDPSGVVLADSEHDPETVENQAVRPEIREAYQGRVGASVRHSDTLDRDLCYVALPVRYSTKSGFVLRLALPLEELDTAIAAVRWRIVRASVLAFVAALLLVYLFSANFTRRVRRLQSFAETFVHQRGTGTLLPDADDELGALARSLNQMTAETQDLVERLKLESARREAILSSMVEGVLAVDHAARITFCNESFTRILGLPAGNLERRPLVELVRDPELLEMLHQVISSGAAVKRRLELPAADGRSFEVQAAPLTASSGRGAIAILHDTTELERLERVRKDFVANVSHELRTPLTAIRGYTETLLNGALEDPENNRKFLGIIDAQAARLNNIASDLLVLSELQSDKHAPEAERICVREVIEAALLTVESEAGVRTVRLICGPIADVNVFGQRIRLEQAVVNLLTNAIKFNRRDGEVRLTVERAENGDVRITIADTGIGIPSQDRLRVFERFYRVDKARSREVGGTGLGLAIVKHVVERMKGTVNVQSELGKGSVFTVSFPSCRASLALRERCSILILTVVTVS